MSQEQESSFQELLAERDRLRDEVNVIEALLNQYAVPGGLRPFTMRKDPVVERVRLLLEWVRDQGLEVSDEGQ